ncbi:hypothetical protein KY284_030052 [Solanum tuberosum]|nr:hypothetical protein KY284_030052 [Solanum tuberosum]
MAGQPLSIVDYPPLVNSKPVVASKSPSTSMGKSFADLLVTKIPIMKSISRKEVVMVQATAVGKPVQLDLATINKTRPSRTRVEVIVGKRISKSDGKRIVKEQNQQYEEPTIPFAHKFLKGKAQVHSSGIVGNRGVWKVTKQKSPINQPPLLENKFAALAEESSSNEASSSHNNIETNSTESVKDHINCITKDPNAQINQQQHEESSKAWVTRAFGKQNESVKIAEPEHHALLSHSHSQVEDKKNKVTDDQQEKQFNHELEINVINVQVMSESKEQDNQVNQEFTGSSSTTGEKREESSTGNTVTGRGGASPLLGAPPLMTGIGNADLVEVEVEQENALAIMEIPKPLQTNEQFMVHSPDKILHDIITHNVGEVECNISDSNQIAEGIVEIEEFDEMWDAIHFMRRFSFRSLIVRFTS